ncbi:MAG: UvrD-helicase domain-containing protein, partial [Clostridiales Family XIII bacterium]|nr:UvrD-helicase domain-containing protein [Clostridiales Family XIII bacterium]
FWAKELRSLSQAEISTIHGYAHSILNRYSWILGLPSELNIDETYSNTDLKEVLEDLINEKNEDILSILKAVPYHPINEFTNSSLLKWMEALSNKMGSWGLSELKSSEKISQKNLNSLLLQLQDLLHKFYDDTRSPEFEKKYSEKCLPESIQNYLEFYDPFVNFISNDKNFEAIHDFQFYFDKFIEKTIFFQPTYSFIRQNSKLCGNYKTEINYLFDEILNWESIRVSEPIKNHLINLSRIIPNKIFNRRLDRGVINFDDILFLARRILHDRPEIRKEEHDRFKLIIVDEFQDTNRLQADLFAYLLQDPASQELKSFSELNWTEIQPKLRVFGDPNQSIYRFRGAEPSIMLKLSDDLEKVHGNTLTLTQNYRTGDKLILFFNDLFENYLETYYRQKTSKKSQNVDDKTVYCLNLTKDLLNITKSTIRREELEASLITLYLKDLFSGKLGITLSSDNSEVDKSSRVPLPGDVSILMRRTKNAHTYEKILQKAGFVTNILQGRSLFDEPTINGLCSAYLFLTDWEKDLNLCSTLISPIGPVSPETLNILVYPEAPNPQMTSLSSYFDESRLSFPDHIEHSEKETLILLRELFLTLKPHVFSRSPGEIIETIIEERNLIPLVFYNEKSSSKRVHDIQDFLERIKCLPINDKSQPNSPRDLVINFRNSDIRKMNEEEEEPEIVLEPHKQAINLMTIHSAKGLEFPIVIIPEAETKIPHSTNFIIDDDGKIAISFKHIGRPLKVKAEDYVEISKKDLTSARQEYNRLFYVATTRAKDHLVVSGKLIQTPAYQDWFYYLKKWDKFQQHAKDYNIDSDQISEFLKQESPRSEEIVTIEKLLESSIQDDYSENLSLSDSETILPNIGMINELPLSNNLITTVSRYSSMLVNNKKNLDDTENNFLKSINPTPNSFDTENEDPDIYFSSNYEKLLKVEIENNLDSSHSQSILSPIDLGILFHMSMEKTNFNLDKNGYFDLLNQCAKNYGLIPSSFDKELNYLAQKALDFQNSHYGLEIQASLKNNRLVWREWSFWLRLHNDILGFNQITLTGVVDLFYENQEGIGQLIDYKLTKPKNVKIYETQIDLYAKAIKMAGFSGEIRKTLWYLES